MERKNVFKFFLLFSASLVLNACNMNTSVESNKDNPTINDFQKTEIIAGEAVPADGTSQLLVAIHLKNSDNRPVKEFQPTYEISNSSNGVITNQCSTSDINGVSVCVLRSTVAGTKLFVLTNAKVGLSKSIEFKNPMGKQVTEITSGAVRNGSTIQGSNLRVTLGRTFDRSVLSTQPDGSGYKIILGK